MSTTVMLLPSRESASHVDPLRWAAAACLARFTGPSRTHTAYTMRRAPTLTAPAATTYARFCMFIRTPLPRTDWYAETAPALGIPAEAVGNRVALCEVPGRCGPADAAAPLGLRYRGDLRKGRQLVPTQADPPTMV